MPQRIPKTAQSVKYLAHCMVPIRRRLVNGPAIRSAVSADTLSELLKETNVILIEKTHVIDLIL